MRLIYFLSFLTLFSYRCISFHNNGSFTGVHVEYLFPVVNWDSTLTLDSTGYDVCYYKDLIMYSNLYKFDSIENGKLLLREKRSRFFVFQNDSSYGYLYYTKPDRSLPKGRLPADSILKYFTIKSNAYDTFSTLRPDSSYNNDEGNLKKVFIHRGTKEQPEDYTISFYYSHHLADIKESFSPEMDNITGMKLFKIIVHTHETYYEKYKMNFPESESRLEMRRIVINNDDVKVKYFKEYKNSIRN
jgi:hypothetical protein